jgi:hypothetical protein
MDVFNLYWTRVKLLQVLELSPQNVTAFLYISYQFTIKFFFYR